MNRLSLTAMGSNTSRPWGEESVPPTPSPERPPLTPHDPPDPAPQAAAWDRALRVIFMESTHSTEGNTKSRSWRTNKRGRAAIKAPRRH
jgi:hypothetical protein